MQAIQSKLQMSNIQKKKKENVQRNNTFIVSKDIDRHRVTRQTHAAKSDRQAHNLLMNKNVVTQPLNKQCTRVFELNRCIEEGSEVEESQVKK